MALFFLTDTFIVFVFDLLDLCGGVHIDALYTVHCTLHLQLYLPVHCTLYTEPAAVPAPVPAPIPVPVLRYMYLTSGTCSTLVAAGTWTIMCIH